MRARIAQTATPRRLLALECCAVALGAGAVVVVLGPSVLALGLLAACTLTMLGAVVAAGRLEKRGSR